MLTDIYQSFFDQLDGLGKQQLTTYLAEEPEGKTHILQFLNAKLSEPVTVRDLETIDVLAYFSDLSVVDATNLESVEGFSSVVEDVSDTGGYK
ncbi:hypothetical protein [Vagococcus humatus]|uniref:Uncharacterized protein n=1 Tax=Vagococcus humatus TaxID=1889241 RepID=A0A3R9ZXE1_9ENTE|nr:hypothetical protein [Vagococcus humatus]RST89965.1 hypothetical protein C7P63_02485 [Vagococcus humatus]